jgi:mono/diheme cytochrome c family protein
MKRLSGVLAPFRSGLLLVLLGFLVGCGGAEGETAGVDLEQMDEQPRYDPYEVGPLFRDDRVLQHPPEGTVPRDRIVGEPLLTIGRIGGEPASEIPIPITPELLALGRKNFGIYCAACHGPGGYGGSVVAMNMQPPLPASLRMGHGAEHALGYYFDVITNGQGRMPSYAAELSVMERWAVVAYLTQVLQQPHPLTEAERLDSLRAETLRRRFPEAGHAR